MFSKKPSQFLVLAIGAVFTLVGCEGVTPNPDSTVKNIPIEQNPVTDPIIVDPTATPTASPIATASPVATTTPVATALVQVKADIQYNGFSASQLAKAQAGVALMIKVLSSQEFKDRVLAFSHGGVGQFYSTNDSNLEVYNTIIAGAENFNTALNNTVNLNLNLYTPSALNKWGTVGYTYANSDQIFTNVYYYNTYTAANLAGHWAHEWTHKLGYEHDYNATSQRPYSVPYAVGELVDELAQKY